MKPVFSMIAVGLAMCGGVAYADDLQDAYDRGYSDGYEKGREAGSILSRAGTAAISVDGSEFNTYIAPKSGTNFSISDDSAVAIVPPSSVEAFKDRLGTDFITNNKIMLNDMAQ